jgi:N6-adenosine-specific RNA methylase IME4
MLAGSYDIILADPPWSYTGQQDKWGAAAKFYPTMTLDDIMALDVGALLNSRGIVFLWATSPLFHHAMTVLDRWGLTFRGVAFVWVKTKKSDPLVPIAAQGVRPSIIKPTTEFVLAASRVATGRPMALEDESICQVVLAPKQEHSRKPDEVQERIERMYPHAKRLEMFARRKRDGWDAWGNEANWEPERSFPGS